MTDLLNFRSRFGKSTVVVFPFPRDGLWALGFIMGIALPHCKWPNTRPAHPRSVTRTRPGRGRRIGANDTDVVRRWHPGYRSCGRFPSNAVPIRTCVAPFAIASRRSPLIPAEITEAVGYPTRSRADTSASDGERLVRIRTQRCDRHHARVVAATSWRRSCRPRGRSRGRASAGSARARRSRRPGPGRRRGSPAPARRAAGPGAPRPRRTARGQADAVHRVHHVGVARPPSGPCCAAAARRSASARPLPRRRPRPPWPPPPGRGSPRRRSRPARPGAARPSAG